MVERNISRVIRGVTLRGTYSVQDSTVTVKTTLGSKSSHVRGLKASSLAFVMLGQLYHETRDCRSTKPIEQ
jgi:hypothetical protein